MGTSSETNAKGKQAYWEKHLQTWRKSGKPQLAYCREANLKPHTFWYWKRKFTALEVPTAPGNEPTRQQGAFIAVDVHPSQANLSGLTIALPSGIRMTGVNAQNLPLVKQLIESLA